MKKIIIVIGACLLILGIVYHKMLIRLYQGYQGKQASIERSRYYTLNQNTQIEDITQKIINDDEIPLDLKKPFINGERRLIVFKYPSDTNEVAGYLSYLTKGENPLVIFLRGGNGYYGIMRPNNKFSLLNNYNVVGTLYRGNLYGGEDQFGGEDVRDVINLVHYFPQLEALTHKKLAPPFTMMGVSRGAMEMFLALSRFEELKQTVTHAISLSGNVDLNVSRTTRPEMNYLFEQQFKKSNAKNINEWINFRDPVYNAKFLPKSIKILLIYGLADNRVPLEEQEKFLQALKEQNIDSQLVTIPGGDHGLNNHFPEVENTIKKFMQAP